ncbi:P44/Msp2 family outer membrane protein, partial [Anaplasma phagocytophilum]|uniref:P44/Msp2 family outer membrane protein n=1 Tax=Anaplasma phagocytophilum TaxID=948 RepID=UPI0007E51184
GIGGARVELEIGYERFKIKGIRDSGSKEDEADTVYLLAKELAYDVVNSQTKKLTTALAGYKGEDIVRFADALGISHSKIDGQVCVTKKGGSGKNANKFATYADKTDNGTENDGKNKVTFCGAAANANVGGAAGGADTAETLKHFAAKTLKDGKNWPTSTNSDGSPTSDTNNNAEAVAKDLTKLTTEEKTVVAGLLAKTIEGGEVVEIRAVSSTSVMVNACYDLLSEGLGVVPYACVGLGGNFVGVVDGIHYTNHL